MYLKISLKINTANTILIIAMLWIALPIAYGIENPFIFSSESFDINLISKTTEKAKEGDANSQASLGFYYWKIKNYQEALKWLHKAAENDNRRAQTGLGLIYIEGNILPQNNNKGMKLLLMAASEGESEAQNQLGLIYSQDTVAPQNYDEAEKWFLLSAKQNNPNAQHNLGYMYHKGLGVKQDHSKAFYWYKKAAEQGLSASQMNVAILYAEGNGTEKDYIRAYSWFLVASKNGEILATKAMETIKKELSPSQLALALKLAGKIERNIIVRTANLN